MMAEIMFYLDKNTSDTMMVNWKLPSNILKKF